MKPSIASPQGPGVMPGQIGEIVHAVRAVGASTKGPGVMPGQVEFPSHNAVYIGCLNEGTGRYARSALRDEDQVRRPRASTKGPGVMPGQFGPHTRGDSKSKASTKGPGVMPGQRASMTAVTCSVMPQRRDRALCPVSRRLDAARLLVLASTKGPGVMPGQLDASAEGRPAVGRASTKGPGVMPGQAH